MSENVASGVDSPSVIEVSGSGGSVDKTSESGSEKADWQPYEGPQGGFGWRNPETDEIVYQDTPPGDPDLSALSGEQIEALEEALGEDLTDSDNLPETAMSSDKDDIVEGEYAYIGEEEGFLDRVDRVGDDVRVRLDDGSEFWVGDKEVHIDTEPERIREDQEEREKVQRVQRSVDIKDESSAQFVKTEQIENNLVRMTESVKQDVVADNLLENVEEIDRSMFGGSYYQHSQSKVNITPQATDSTLNHEVGHAIAGSNGYDFPVEHAVVFAKVFIKDDQALDASESPFMNDDTLDPKEYIGQTWGDLADDLWEKRGIEAQNLPIPEDARDEEITLDSFKLQKQEEVDTSEEMETLIDEVNNAWEEQFQMFGKNNIGDTYSSTNAHETMSRLHEHLQSPGINFNVMDDLMEDFPDLLEAYLDVLEPNESQMDYLEKEGFL